MCCAAQESLLIVQFNLMSLSTIKQQLNKQGVFSEGLDTGSIEHCQMTAQDFDESSILMNA